MLGSLDWSSVIEKSNREDLKIRLTGTVDSARSLMSGELAFACALGTLAITSHCNLSHQIPFGVTKADNYSMVLNISSGDR